MADLFSFAATRHADRTVVEEKWSGRTRTAHQLFSNASRVANGLLASGSRKGDRAVIMLPNRIEFIETEIAVAISGLVKVAVPLGLSRNEIREQLEFLEPVALVIEFNDLEIVRDILPGIGSLKNVIVLDRSESATPLDLDIVDYLSILKEFNDDTPARIDPTDLYGLRFTSGSTGKPKAVLHDHSGFSAMVRNQLTNVNWGDYLGVDERFLQFLPLSAGTIFWVHSCIVSGATTIIDDGFDPIKTLDALTSTRATCTFMVPPMINALLQASDGKPQNMALRTVFMGGSAMPSAQRAAAEAAFGSVFLHYYAASEYPVCSITNRLDDTRAVGSSCGRPAVGTDVAILDEADTPVATGSIGNLLIRGDHTFKEYWKNPIASAATKTRDGWVRTGDMARQDANGYIYLVERKQDMIGAGALQVAPQEVEEVIAAIPGVAEVAVFGATTVDINGDESVGPVAVVVAKPGSLVTEADIVQGARLHLPDYKVPTSVYLRSDLLPRSALGKILRREVRKLLTEGDAGVGGWREVDMSSE